MGLPSQDGGYSALPSLRELIDAFDEPTLLTDERQLVRAANQRAIAWLGLPTTASGVRLAEVLSGDRIRAWEGLRNLLRPEFEPAGEAMVPVTLSGAEGAPSVTWSLLRVPGADGRRYVLHRLYPAPQEEPDVDRTEFLANVTHELRTPLTALVATTELLLQDYQNIPVAELGSMIGLIHRNTRRLEGLVSNLLDAAALQRGQLQLRRAITTVQSLIRDASDFVHPILSSKNQRLETRVIGNPAALNVDPKRIVGVLVNLLSNASRYGSPNEPIQLIVSSEGTLVRFTVRQKGSGIPRHEQVRIFQRFYRASATENIANGTGLGLAIVKELVEKHGGTVGVASSPGKSTAFWFTVPLGTVDQ